MIVRGEGEITVSNKAGVIQVNEQKHADQYGINKLEHGRIGAFVPEDVCQNVHPKPRKLLRLLGKKWTCDFVTVLIFYLKRMNSSLDTAPNWQSTSAVIRIARECNKNKIYGSKGTLSCVMHGLLSLSGVLGLPFR